MSGRAGGQSSAVGARAPRWRLCYTARAEPILLITYQKPHRLFWGLLLLLSACYAVYSYTDLVFGPPRAVSSDSAAGEWRMFRHDTRRAGAADADAGAPRGVLKWQFATGAAIHSSPAVADGIVYVGSQDARFYALDAETGREIWSFAAESWIDSSPAVAGGVVYFGSNDGNLYALDARTGAERWRFETRLSIRSSPAVAGGTVYFGTDNYTVFAVDAASGAQRWIFHAEGRVDSSPVVAGGIVYIGSTRYLYGLHARDGRMRFDYKVFASVLSSPAVQDGTVYVMNSRGELYAIDGAHRTWPMEHRLRPYWIQLWAFGLPVPRPQPPSGFLWKYRLGRTSRASPVIAGDTAYIAADTGLAALDVASRTPRWEYAGGRFVKSSPALAGDALVAASDDGALHALDAVSGELRWRFRTGGIITSSPAFAGGVVFVGSHDGTLYAIE